MIDRWAFRLRCRQRERTRRHHPVCGESARALSAQREAWPTAARLSRPWEHERFVVLDTEATGLDHRADRPVSLGAVTVVAGRIHLGDTFSRVLASEVLSSRTSVIVHGLTPDKVALGTPPHDALSDFLVWAGDAILVAHHASFDLAMLNPTAVQLHGLPLQNLVLDTIHLARRVERDSGYDYDLDSLLQRFEISQSGNRHTALGDALLTARLLQRLLKHLKASGAVTLRDLALSPF
ncbi:MAG: 3'-5' exonuclease [Kiritimatiellia bacterium]|nr:3'-5' exonuclease [Kiritimatiellia bacterium]